MKTLARAACRTEIASRLRTLAPHSSRRWGQMSVDQMICHLSDAYRMAMGEKPVSDAPGRMPRVAVKWMALYLPMRWPPGLLTRPEIDQHCAGTKPGNFAADVAELESLLERMATQERGFAWPTHPIFGRMSRAAWLRWGYLHADHHLRQFGA